MNTLSIPKAAFIYITAALFIIIPTWSFIFKGPFSWHITQPEAWQGIIEIFILFYFIYRAIVVENLIIKYITFFIPVEIYARRHGVDFSIIILYIYIQGIFSIGWLIMSKGINSTYRYIDKIYISFYSGLCFWLLIIWGVSAIGFGSIENIRLITLGGLGGIILFSNAPQLVKIISPWLQVKKTTERLSVGLISILFLVLFAKISSAQTINYDSMWYGLQLEKSMLAEGGIYANQGLVALVHYYPKLYESLLIPFAGLGSMSLMMGLAVFFWLALTLTCYSILREFRVDTTLSLLIVTLVATIPALGSIAMTTKGDVVATWLGLIALFFLLRFYNTKKYLFFWSGISVIIFSVLARLSVIPYVSLVFLVLIYYGYKFRGNKEASGSWSVYVLPLSATFTIALVLARNIILSGVPFVGPTQLVELTRHFGMDLIYPLSLPTENINKIPVLFGTWSYLFDPANVGILLITWIGNAWLFFLVFAVVVSKKWLKDITVLKGLLLIIGLLFPLLLFTMKVGDYRRGLDGNYFIYPIVCIFIFNGLLLHNVFNVYKPVISRLALSFAIFSSIVIFITADWGPGTRRFDLNFARMPFELDSKIINFFRNKDRADLFRYFKTVPRSSRVIGINSEEDGSLPFGWLLPIRYEPIEVISWSNPAIVSSADSFEQYLMKSKIEYIIIPTTLKNECNKVAICSVLTTWEDENKLINILENNRYVVFRLLATNPPLKYSQELYSPGNISLELPQGKSCENISNLEIKVSWNFPNAEAGIRIKVKAISQVTSNLWMEEGNAGSATTGPWMGLGSSFEFIDIKSNKLLAVCTVNQCDMELLYK